MRNHKKYDTTGIVSWITVLLLGITVQGYSQDDLNIVEVAHLPQPVVCNDIWGYVDSSGLEYAILGTQEDTRIYSLEDPSTPVLRKIIPGTNSIWRDYKSYRNRVYSVADRGTEGLTIIDMSMAPDSISFTRWKDTLNIGFATSRLNRCHNLYIDKGGTAYLAGCNISQGGVIFLDLNQDPDQPVHIGEEDLEYAHDVFVQDEILFASEIFTGDLGIYDISNKDSVVLLSRTRTSTAFTHNAWASEDGLSVFTTDERANGFVDAYDITDLSAPVRLDKYQPLPNAGIIPHNTHYLNGYLINSWYTQGVIILDAHQPDQLVRVGQFDTNPQDADGNWGVYPFLPSGIILASDMNNGLFILEPNYVRASYVRGNVMDAQTETPINNAQIHILGPFPDLIRTNATGTYKVGIPESGQVQFVTVHPDYKPDTTLVDLMKGETVEHNILLEAIPYSSVSGKIFSQEGHTLNDARIEIFSDLVRMEINADIDGNFELDIPEGQYVLSVGQWGYKSIQLDVSAIGDKEMDIMLTPGYEDDFIVDLGWQVSGSASAGKWTRAVPMGTTFMGLISNPDADLDHDLGRLAFVTGNDGRSVGFDDVDNGSTILESPPIDVSDFSVPILKYHLWFFNSGGNSPPNDFMSVSLVTDQRTIEIERLGPNLGHSGSWRDSSVVDLSTILSDEEMDDILVLRIEVSDDEIEGHLVEGGFDGFKIYDSGLTTSNDNPVEESLVIFPNPASSKLYLAHSQILGIKEVAILSLDGRIVRSYRNPGHSIPIDGLSKAGYLVRILLSDDTMAHKMFIKI